MNSKFIRLLQSASLLLFLISTTILISFTTFEYSYFVGWSIGALAAIIGHLTINYAFKALSKNKKYAATYAMVRQVINLILQGIIFLSVIIINNASNGIGLLSGTTTEMLWPINIIAYIAGFTSTWFAVLFNLTIKKGL